MSVVVNQEKKLFAEYGWWVTHKHNYVGMIFVLNNVYIALLY